MSVKLTIELSAPLGPDDVTVLTATTMTLIAITSSLGSPPTDEEEAEEAASEAFVAALVHEELLPNPCGKIDSLGRVCVSDVGHRGRHLFRKIPQPLAN